MKPIILKNALVLAAVAFALVGCQSKQVQNTYIYKPRPAVVEPKTMPVRMKGVEWKVITKPELERMLVELEKNPDPNFALFALTPQGFEALSTNLVEINRFMQEQQQVIRYYRAYIKETQ